MLSNNVGQIKSLYSSSCILFMILFTPCEGINLNSSIRSHVLLLSATSIIICFLLGGNALKNQTIDSVNHHTSILTYSRFVTRTLVFSIIIFLMLFYMFSAHLVLSAPLVLKSWWSFPYFSFRMHLQFRFSRPFSLPCYIIIVLLKSKYCYCVTLSHIS